MTDKQGLDYNCQIPHHEYDFIDVRIEHSQFSNETVMNIAIDDGGGRDGKASRIYISAEELRQLMFLMNKFQDAKNILEIQNTEGNA